MSDVVIELAERGIALAPQDRTPLVDMLLESLHEASTAEIASAWDAEIGHRLAEYDSGSVKAVDAAEVFAKARFLPAAELALLKEVEGTRGPGHSFSGDGRSDI
ncbi:MAG: addiction module protein [Pseudomonadota bacterium]